MDVLETIGLSDLLLPLKNDLVGCDLQSFLCNLDEFLSKHKNISKMDIYNQVKELMDGSQTREYVFQNFEKLIHLVDVQSKPLKNKANVRTFLDSCQLETARYLDMQSHVEQLETTTQMIQSSMDYFNHELPDLDDKVRAAQNDIQESTPKFITILGIFAGIVITFMGGMSLLGSAFNAMQSNYSKYRILFMLALTGFVIYNTIISLMFIIGRFNRNKIAVTCLKSSDCLKCEHYHKTNTIRNLICRSFNQYPYLALTDYFLLYLIYVISILWVFSPNNKDVFQNFLFLHNWAIELLLILCPVCITVYFLKFHNRHVDKSSPATMNEKDDDISKSGAKVEGH